MRSQFRRLCRGLKLTLEWLFSNISWVFFYYLHLCTFVLDIFIIQNGACFYCLQEWYNWCDWVLGSLEVHTRLEILLRQVYFYYQIANPQIGIKIDTGRYFCYVLFHSHWILDCIAKRPSHTEIFQKIHVVFTCRTNVVVGDVSDFLTCSLW